MKDRLQRFSKVLVWASLAGPLLVAAALSACGNVTAGGVGQTEVYMSGDGDGGGAAATSTRAPHGREGATAPSYAIVGAGLEGDVMVIASFYLRTSGGPLVQLTPDGDVTTTLDLAGTQEPLVADEVVSGDRYEGVRVVFTEVVANVIGGLEIGGVPVTGPVTVDLGGDSLIVDRTLAVDVGPDQPAELLVDLNSDVWLNLLAPGSDTVTGSDFAEAVAITTR